MKRLQGILLVIYGVFLPLLLAGAAYYVVTHRADGSKNQPIAYNHKKHIELGLECAACHTGIAEGKARARLPTVDICAACHASEDENPGTKTVRDYVSAGKPIPWKRIYDVPPHVYFSHRRHVGAGKLDCAVCHGDMSKVEAPVIKQAVKISMERCMSCHNAMKATNDCLACHR